MGSRPLDQTHERDLPAPEYPDHRKISPLGDVQGDVVHGVDHAALLGSARVDLKRIPKAHQGAPTGYFGHWVCSFRSSLVPLQEVLEFLLSTSVGTAVPFALRPPPRRHPDRQKFCRGLA